MRSYSPGAFSLCEKKHRKQTTLHKAHFSEFWGENKIVSGHKYLNKQSCEITSQDWPTYRPMNQWGCSPSPRLDPPLRVAGVSAVVVGRLITIITESTVITADSIRFYKWRIRSSGRLGKFVTFQTAPLAVKTVTSTAMIIACCPVVCHVAYDTTVPVVPSS